MAWLSKLFGGEAMELWTSSLPHLTLHLNQPSWINIDDPAFPEILRHLGFFWNVCDRDEQEMSWRAPRLLTVRQSRAGKKPTVQSVAAARYVSDWSHPFPAHRAGFGIGIREQTWWLVLYYLELSWIAQFRLPEEWCFGSRKCHWLMTIDTQQGTHSSAFSRIIVFDR